MQLSIAFWELPLVSISSNLNVRHAIERHLCAIWQLGCRVAVLSDQIATLQGCAISMFSSEINSQPRGSVLQLNRLGQQLVDISPFSKGLEAVRKK